MRNIPNPIELTTSILSRPFSGAHAEDNAHILADAIDWAMEAGKLQLQNFRNRHMQMETKSSMHDVVTEIDKACEKMLIERIQRYYPSHSILAEEGGSLHNNGEWEWVIDPLDGTNNYSQGLPVFCVSIGIKYKGETQVGVVYVPYLDELFTASKGDGASWNGRTIHVSHKNNLDECIVATGFPYDKGSVCSADNNLDNVNALLPKLRGLRRMGSAAYDLCCVAAGILDGYWELNLKPWDACAGCLMVEEAGGQIVSFRNDRNISIVAGHKNVVNLLMQHIR